MAANRSSSVIVLLLHSDVLTQLLAGWAGVKQCVLSFIQGSFSFWFSPRDISFIWWNAARFILFSLTGELMSWYCPKLGTGSLKYNLIINGLPITKCCYTLIKSNRSGGGWSQQVKDHSSLVYISRWKSKLVVWLRFRTNKPETNLLRWSNWWDICVCPLYNISRPVWLSSVVESPWLSHPLQLLID